MRTAAVAGLLAVVATEAFTYLLGYRALLLTVAAIPAVLALWLLRLQLRSPEPAAASTAEQDRSESLERWRARTEILIDWSEGSRADWDQHLRPVLAREFAHVIAEQRASGSGAPAATGTLLFGPDLWRWVDPNQIAGPNDADRASPGPGRPALAEILDRLEQL